MKVLYVTDFSLRQCLGGSQRTTSFILEEGRKRGHEVREFNHDSPITQIYLRNYDLIISSNLEALMQSENASEIFNFLVKHPKHVRYERDSCLYLHPQNRKLLFEKARLNVFLSDFHLEFFREMYGDYFHDTHVIPPYLDVERFKPAEGEKEYDVVYCGFLHPLKGSDALADYAIKNPQRKITIFGWGDEKIIKELDDMHNVEFKGKLEYDEIPAMLQKTRHIFHCPVVNEPFCRMIGEAMFCGAEFVGDKHKIGAVQDIKEFGLDQVRTNCSNANKDFWDLIESIHETNN